MATLALLATIPWTTPPERGSFFALVLIGVAAGAALWVRRGESLVLTLTDAVLVLTGVGVDRGEPAHLAAGGRGRRVRAAWPRRNSSWAWVPAAWPRRRG